MNAERQYYGFEEFAVTWPRQKDCGILTLSVASRTYQGTWTPLRSQHADHVLSQIPALNESDASRQFAAFPYGLTANDFDRLNSFHRN